MVGRGKDWSLKLKIEDRSMLKLKNQGTIWQRDNTISPELHSECCVLSSGSKFGLAPDGDD